LQQNADFELVVLDDFYLNELTQENRHATESLREYLCADKRVKCFSNDKPLTIQDNWNKTVSLSTGNYIKLMGADDKIMQDGIVKMENMIRTYPLIAFHGHLANIIDSGGAVLRQQQPYGKNYTNRPITGAEALKGKLRQQVRFKEPACNFYLKSAWEEVGGYDNKFRFAFDVHFNVKMMSGFSSILWNEYLVYLRRHPASDGAQLPVSLALADLRGVLDEILKILGSESTVTDRAAASGLLEYRVIELLIQRINSQPVDVIKLFLNNFSLFLNNPISYFYMTKLLWSRGVTGDVQQN
jgi:hypothetical protein